nr:PspA/IM30 family protein [Pseudomonas sp. DG56-2]
MTASKSVSYRRAYLNCARQLLRAKVISTLEISVADDRKQERELSQSVSELRKAVAQGEGHVKRLQQQVDTVKATESVYRAQMTVARRFGGSQATMQTAVESLERIKQKQAERKARMEADAELAAQESSDEALDAKLRGAGIAPAEASANSVLARLREKANV